MSALALLRVSRLVGRQVPRFNTPVVTHVRFLFGGSKAPEVQHTKATDKHNVVDPLGADSDSDIDSDEEDMVQMVDPNTGEWGGPTKGGTMPEPTRFGDWERAGRCTDFS